MTEPLSLYLSWSSEARKTHLLILQERLGKFIEKVRARDEGETSSHTEYGVWKAPVAFITDGDARFILAMVNYLLASGMPNT